MADAKPKIAILGAGPTGLEAALAAAETGFPFTLYESTPAVGGNVRAWGHVRLFTPWSLNVSPRMRRHLETALATRWQEPDSESCPTGHELVERLLEPLAALPAVAVNLRRGTRVLAVGRQGLLKHEEIATPERARHPFRLLLADGEGRERIETADLVLDTTGTYSHPNSLGDGGIPAPGERTLREERLEYTIPDLAREAQAYAGRRILVAGSGHSAQTAVRDLAELARQVPGTQVIWVLRGENEDWGSHPGDPLPERARLAADSAALAGGAFPAVTVRRGAVVEDLHPADGHIEVTLRTANGTERVPVDRVLALTGSVGDAGLYRQLQIHECYATCGPMKLSAALLGAAGGDCMAQTSHGAEALTNPEPGFFILGSKSYGRNNTFLMRIGWEQVDEVFATL